MATKSVITTPNQEALRERAGWTKIGVNQYIAVRHHFLIVESTTEETKDGPAFSTFKWPAGAKLKYEKKKIRTTKTTDQLAQGLEATLLVKLSHEVASSMNASANVSTDSIGSSFGASLSSKLGTEVTDSLKSTLSGIRTYEIVDTVEDTQTFEDLLPTDGSPLVTVHKFVVLRPVYWDVYLIGSEILALQWRRTWYWSRVRETIREAVDNRREPVARITFYQPDPEYGLTYGKYMPEVTAESLTQVSEPVSQFVPKTALPNTVSLKSLARIAFPTTADWIKGKVLRPARPATRRPATTGAAPSRASKMGGRRAATKPSASRGVSKKAKAVRVSAAKKYKKNTSRSSAKSVSRRGSASKSRKSSRSRR